MLHKWVLLPSHHIYIKIATCDINTFMLSTFVPIISNNEKYSLTPAKENKSMHVRSMLSFYTVLSRCKVHYACERKSLTVHVLLPDMYKSVQTSPWQPDADCYYNWLCWQKSRILPLFTVGSYLYVTQRVPDEYKPRWKKKTFQNTRIYVAREN